MKTLCTIILAFALTGCFYQTVNSNDIEVAQKICAKTNSTVVEIRSLFGGKEFVVCSDRASFELK